ncbi:FMN-dependent NADH-azoreductase [Vagococcus penaei]|uniref:FMN dependent NADH:quinone oxidoreductase n=1 Tax=Vagococcus penaei TaxID=633807 RepID=A0A1Q2D7Y9_9ENTE|nr:FMN-dependent NADH-azoreductase [Vagococcus penaei]AQP54451.1 FMN-dependent NADH-azoreductase [Vagococcus penaei]RSU06368.1 FMN-dependent NADH-azoreductase [Vagococcus penaei]
MSNLLVVKAHPLSSAESKSLMALEAFIDSYRTENPTDTITVLDLYDEFIPEIDRDMLLGWSSAAQGNDLTEEQANKIARFSELTEQFLAHDKIVIANPLWNLNIPTRLKAWIDTINVAGKTFKYTETGPVPLTENKTFFHIQSSGGIYAGQDLSAQYLKNILNFVGVTDTGTLFIEGIDHHPEQREAILSQALADAREAAKNF